MGLFIIRNPKEESNKDKLQELSIRLKNINEKIDSKNELKEYIKYNKKFNIVETLYIVILGLIGEIVSFKFLYPFIGLKLIPIIILLYALPQILTLKSSYNSNKQYNEDILHIDKEIQKESLKRDNIKKLVESLTKEIKLTNKNINYSFKHEPINKTNYNTVENYKSKSKKLINEKERTSL